MSNTLWTGCVILIVEKKTPCIYKEILPGADTNKPSQVSLASSVTSSLQDSATISSIALLKKTF